MAELSEIREALVIVLRRTGWNVTGHPPSQVNPPAIFVGARSGKRETQDGGDLITWPLFAAVALGNPSHFDKLDRLIDGPDSLVDIIDANDSLGIDGVSAFVSGEWSEGDFEIGGQSLYGVRFTLDVRL